MNNNDTQPDNQHLDRILLELCDLILRGQKQDSDLGWVAACVLDANGNEVYGINVPAGPLRVHAERVAVDRYREQFGDLPADAIVITTLSPCSDTMPDRYGSSCTDFLKEHNISRVYCGYQDPTQLDGYEVTANQDIRNLCKKFADVFLKPQKMLKENRNNQFILDKVNWICGEIDLDPDQLPKIELLDRPNTTAFGSYDSANNVLYLVTAGRHPIDVLRTMAHELVHHKQRLEGKLKPESSQTGSDEENEANSTAGVIMRNFAQQNPHYFGIANEDFTGRPRPGSRPGSLLRKAGKKKGEKIGPADLLRLDGRARHMKSSNNKATRERGVQLQRQVNWYRNFHKKKSEAVDADLLKENQLRVDVPNEEWLQRKIDYAASRGRDRYGAPYMGTATAWVRGEARVPVDLLMRLPGMRGEQQNVRHDDLAAIVKIMCDTGRLPLTRSGEEYPPFVMVAYNGEAWVNEGNHRIMAAAQLGWPSLPVEIKYYDGGERVEDGPLYPGKIGLSV